MDGEAVFTLECGEASGSEGGVGAGEAVSFEDYSFTYIGSDRPALRNIDLKIRRGEIVLIAGPSGCGKSTLLRSINGLIPHMYPGEYSGSVKVSGLEVSKTSVVELAKRVGFVFQNPENQIFMFSVERDVAFGLENLGLPREEIRGRVDHTLRLLKIEHLAHRAPHELSDGQKQRVAIAGVLAMKPDILILDEPTSLLDPRTAMELVDVVKGLHDELGITILIVEHRLDLLTHVATRIVGMSNGEVVIDGPPRRVLVEEEAHLIGIGVPTVTRLHSLLKEDVNLGETALSTGELAKRLSVLLR